MGARSGSASVPLIDLVLLIATAAHLRSGATAGVEHGLAAIYIGFSVAYGHRLIGWADVRFAHRFAGGPAPRKLYGAAYARQRWGDVGRTSIAALIASALTAALIWWIGNPARTDALRENDHWLAVIWGLDILWAVSTVVWPQREPAPNGWDAMAQLDYVTLGSLSPARAAPSRFVAGRGRPAFYRPRGSLLGGRAGVARSAGRRVAWGVVPRERRSRLGRIGRDVT